jgi:predicted acetyltransferase
MSIACCTSRTELEEVVDVCDRAFDATPREYFERHVLRDPTLRPEDTLIARHDGRIVSSVQIFPRQCWIDGRIVAFAGIGNVATDPAHRRAGHAGQLLSEAVRVMQARGFPFSMLTTTINAYYAKFGYTTVTRELAVFPPVVSQAQGVVLREFRRDADLGSVRETYDAWNRESVGPIARDTAYWNAQFDFCGEDPGMFLVAEERGRIRGFIRGNVEKGYLQVLEYALASSPPETFHALLGALSARRPDLSIKMFLSDREKERLRLRVPFALQTDTDTMILLLDEEYRRMVEERVMRPGVLMYWLADFF